MTDNKPAQPAARRWRPITTAALTAVAAAVTLFACLSGPSSAAQQPDQSHATGLNDRVPTEGQGAIGGNVGATWWQDLTAEPTSGR